MCFYNPFGSDALLIIASDGLWEFVSDQDAVDLIAGFHSF